ncbi:MAG: hypothetical protein ACXWCQ_35115 [Burkholderiales bacterium]
MMSFRLTIGALCLLVASLVGRSCIADEERSMFGITIPQLVPGVPNVFGDGREGLRYASCFSADPDVGGPAQAFLMFLPHDVLARDSKFDAIFFWVVSDEGKRYLPQWGWVEFLSDDMSIYAGQGGDWTDEAMERTIIPLLNTHPRVAHSPEEVFKRPRGRCRYSPHWDYINPKPRHRPKIKPEWFATK